MGPKILIVGPAWVGDMVMSQSLYKIIKQQEPDAQIDILAPSWSAPLTCRMPQVHTNLDSMLKSGELGLKKRYHLSKVLKKRGYDKAFILPNSFKSALIPFFARVPQRIGWRGEYRDILLTSTKGLNVKKFPYMVQRFAALAYSFEPCALEQIPKPSLEIDAQMAQTIAAQFNLSIQEPILALCPGAEFGPSKRWPEEKYASVAKHFITKGWQVWLFGSKNDLPSSEKIAALCANKVVNLAGKTTLNQAIDLLAFAKAVVSNDSGLMHIACALNLPTVALFGSTDPNFTPPLGNQVKIHRNQTACSPCFQRICGLKHHDCMNKLSWKPVVEALESFVI